MRSVIECIFRIYLSHEQSESKVSEEHTCIFSEVVVKCPYKSLQCRWCFDKSTAHKMWPLDDPQGCNWSCLPVFTRRPCARELMCLTTWRRYGVCLVKAKKRKGFLVFSTICKGRLHRFSVTWDSIKPTPTCLRRIIWSFEPYKLC